MKDADHGKLFRKSKIEWTEATWNPVVGCSMVSRGCEHCYAMRAAHRLSGHPSPKIRDTYKGLTVAGNNGAPKWTGSARLVSERLTQPLHWRPRYIFVNSMSDLFHEDIKDEEIARVLAIIGICGERWYHDPETGEHLRRLPPHIFQILTKRPQRMAELFSPAWHYIRGLIRGGLEELGFGEPTLNLVMGREWPWSHLWLGISAEDQAAANDRIPLLLQTQAALRFVSYEPALGPINLDAEKRKADLDWVIVGGESGPGARPFRIEWAQGVIDQCKEAGIPVFLKQLGANVFLEDGRPWRGKNAKGADMEEWPAHLHVRKMPLGARSHGAQQPRRDRQGAH